MYCKILHPITGLFCLVFCTLFFNTATSSLWAQQAQERVYAETQTNRGFLGTVANPSNVVDGEMNTFTSLSVPLGALGLSSAYIQPRFESVLAAGTPTHIKIGANPSLLGVGITVSVQAYNGNTAAGNSVDMGSLLSLLDGQYTEEIVFIPESNTGPVSYDGVRITLNGGALSVAANVDVYYAYYLDDATTSIACDAPVEVMHGAVGGVAGAINAVVNPENVIDGDLNTYAFFQATASLIGKTFIKTVYDTPSKPGDMVRVVLKEENGELLNLSLLSGNFIRTYYNNIDNGFLEVDTSLLSLELLPGSNDIQVLTIPVDTPFNRIEIAKGEGVLELLGGLRVYEIERIPQSPKITAPNLENDELHICYGDEVTLSAANPVSGSVYRWYTTATGTTPSHTGTSYNITDLETTTYYLAESRQGCTDESARASVVVHVSPDYGSPEISILNENN